ncbi:hypothetical protein G6L00_03065 [Agrobacterium rhizogenes]|nr:hypothetical protein [Rhizobium rhizogenes]NTI99291.1 hypothetical protein [Rhizobium rhizogenes]
MSHESSSGDEKSDMIPEPVAAPSKQETLEAYNSIIERADLLDIRLMDLKFNVKHQYYAAIAKGDDDLQHAFENDLAEMTYDAPSGLLMGNFRWVTKVTKGKKKLLEIDAKFYATYHGVPDVDQVHMDAFLRRVGKFATYPYFRGVVSRLSWESHAELPIMPVLK